LKSNTIDWKTGKEWADDLRRISERWNPNEDSGYNYLGVSGIALCYKPYWASLRVIGLNISCYCYVMLCAPNISSYLCVVCFYCHILSHRIVEILPTISTRQMN
jgi:hypothetical protein